MHQIVQGTQEAKAGVQGQAGLLKIFLKKVLCKKKKKNQPNLS